MHLEWKVHITFIDQYDINKHMTWIKVELNFVHSASCGTE